MNSEEITQMLWPEEIEIQNEERMHKEIKANRESRRGY